MAGVPISDVFNEPAIAESVKRVIAQIESVAKAMEDMQKVAKNASQFQIAVAGGQAATDKLSEAIDKLTASFAANTAAKGAGKASMTELERLTAAYQKGIEKLNASLSEESKRAIQMKEINREVQAELRTQAKEVLGLSGAYQKLEAEFKRAKTAAQNIGATMGVASEEYKKAAASALELNMKLKAIDSGVGNFQRNVGNYASGFTAFNHVLRETPNFAISAQTGIQALSNNIPMLVDEISAASKAGLGFTGVLKALGASLISFGGLAAIAMGLFMLVPKLIASATKEWDALDKAMRKNGDVMEAQKKAMADEQLELASLVTVLRAERTTREEKIRVINKLNEVIPEHLGNLTLEGEITGKNDAILTAYTEKLKKYALAEAYLTLIKTKSIEMVELQNSSLSESMGALDKFYRWAVSGSSSKLATGLRSKIDEDAAYTRRMKVEQAKLDLEALKQQMKVALETGEAELQLDDAKKDSKKKKGKVEREETDKSVDFEIKRREALGRMEEAALKDRALQFKSIRDDETMMYQTRIIAAQKFYALDMQLADNEHAKKIDKILLREKELADEKAKISKDPTISTKNKGILIGNIIAEQRMLDAQKMEVTAEYHKNVAAATSAFYDKLDSMAKTKAKKELDDAEKLAADKKKIETDKLRKAEDDLVDRELRSSELLHKKLKNIHLDYLEGKYKDEKAYQRDIEAATLEHNRNSLLNQIATLKAKLDTVKTDGKERQKMLDELAAAEAALNALSVKNMHKTSNEKLSDFRDVLGKIDQMVRNMSQAIGEIASIGFENRKAQLDEEKERIEANSAAEIEKIKNSSLSLQEQADMLVMLEARKQAQIEANDAKQRKLAMEKARFDRLNSIAAIISGTAVAVVNALGAFPFKPWNIAIAATVGALGLAQLAKAMSAPIPKYKHGTKNHKGGLAVVGDGGVSERIILPSGEQFDSPNKATLVDLPKGTKVLPDASAINRIMLGSVFGADKKRDNNREIVEWQTRQLIKGIGKPKVNTKVNVNLGRDIYLYNQVYK